LPYKPGGCLNSCVSHTITNAMIENGCSLVFPPWGPGIQPPHAKHGMVIDAHAVASTPFKARKCFCLIGLWPKIRQRALADKFKPPAMRPCRNSSSRPSPAKRARAGIQNVLISFVNPGFRSAVHFRGYANRKIIFVIDKIPFLIYHIVASKFQREFNII
jgi:hypothetical protein